MNFSTFFSHIQEAPWYRDFLQPVINEVGDTGRLLDIGTGSGKLLQRIVFEKNIECVGVDTSGTMLQEAKIKLANTQVKLLKINPNTKLEFEDASFDYITICNVLFHLNQDQIDYMLLDSLRLLKEKGKIIILTPTGNGTILGLTKNYFSIKNSGILIWFYATKNKAKQWINNNYLKQYAHENKLTYHSKTVMSGLAQLEIITP